MQPNRPPPHAEWAPRARLRRAVDHWLRMLASRIDCRWTYAIEVRGNHRPSYDAIRQAVALGLQVIKRGAIDQLSQAARFANQEFCLGAAAGVGIPEG